VTHDWQVGFEVKLEHAQRLAHIGGGRGNGHQGQHHVALLHVVFDPLLVDGDVALEEVKACVAHPAFDAVAHHVHAIHLPVRALDDVTCQVVADESIDAEDEDFEHRKAFRSSECVVDQTSMRTLLVPNTRSNASAFSARVSPSMRATSTRTALPSIATSQS
jgi:hypothetical protein